MASPVGAARYSVERSLNTRPRKRRSTARATARTRQRAPRLPERQLTPEERADHDRQRVHRTERVMGRVAIATAVSVAVHGLIGLIVPPLRHDAWTGLILWLAVYWLAGRQINTAKPPPPGIPNVDLRVVWDREGELR